MTAEAGQVDDRISVILETVKQREAQERDMLIETPTVQLVVFLLGATYYAFYGDQIKEIVPVTHITRVPGMPAFFPGVINVRGEIESVLDLHQVFLLPPAQITKRSRIAIGQVGELRSGMLVDSVEDVLGVPADSIAKPISITNETQADYILGESAYNEQLLILLDVGKMFEKLLTQHG